jgi:hypothetical protein|tara:strand:+ start:757 stop:933 length:177 start_codon:yes stop_codon:yes gene_type:complete
MKNIKFTSKTSLKLDGRLYRGYTVGELPMKFGFLYDSEDDKDGISEWFNMRGLTWVIK